MKDITKNIINSLFPGTLFFLGALSDGEMTWKGIYIAFILSLIMGLKQFQEYWTKVQMRKQHKKLPPKTCLFNFI